MTTTTIADGTSDPPPNVLLLARLLVVPTIALAVILALTLGSATPQGVSGPVFVAGLGLPDERPITLYLLAGDSLLAAALDEGELIRNTSRAEPLLDWYARVSTPTEEAEIMRAWDHANWIRSDLGLPAIRFVDLRRPSPKP